MALDWTSASSWLRDLWTKVKEATVCLLHVFGRMGRGIHRFVRRIEPWVLFVTSAAVVPTLVALMIELEDRQSQRIFQAWEVVFDASKILVASRSQQKKEEANSTPNNSFPPPFYPPPVLGSGVRQALQFLNSEFEESGCSSIIHRLSKLLAGNRSRKCIFPDKERESFEGLSLPGIDLSEAQLPGADLTEADLAGGALMRVIFAGANLTGADLTGANLANAILPNAILTGANLTGAAILTGANLTGADFTGADLAGADLANATFYLVDFRGVKLDDTQLPDIQKPDMCVWHDATGATQSWVQPAADCRDRLLEFLTELACRDRSTAEAVMRRYADVSELDEQIPPRILDPTEVMPAFLRADPDACPALDPR